MRRCLWMRAFETAFTYEWREVFEDEVLDVSPVQELRKLGWPPSAERAEVQDEGADVGDGCSRPKRSDSSLCRLVQGAKERVPRGR